MRKRDRELWDSTANAMCPRPASLFDVSERYFELPAPMPEEVRLAALEAELKRLRSRVWELLEMAA